MDANALRLSVEHFGFAAILASILAGLMFSFNPVALASIPVALAYTIKARTPRQAFQFGTMFILGMFVTHAVLGLVAGLGSSGIKALLGRRWGLLLGPLLVLLGLMWAGLIRVPMPRIAFTGMRPDNPIGAFMLSIPFSLAVCPVCTPALVIILGVAASIGSVWVSISLLLAFALGRALPVALGAWSIGYLENLRGLSEYRRRFEIIGAVTLIASGLYMLNAYFLWLPQLAG
jgi:cytochrome c-type biogenesis protein